MTKSERISRCAAAGADWLLYDPARAEPRKAAEERMNSRVSGIRQRQRLYGQGVLAVRDGRCFYLTAQGTAAAADGMPLNIPLLEQTENIRRFYLAGRTCAVVCGDGTVKLEITQDKKNRAEVRRLEKALEPVRRWTDVRYLLVEENFIVGLCEDGRVVMAGERGGSPLPEKDVWAENAAEVADSGTGTLCLDREGRLHCIRGEDSLLLAAQRWEGTFLEAAASTQAVICVKTENLVRAKGAAGVDLSLLQLWSEPSVSAACQDDTVYGLSAGGTLSAVSGKSGTVRHWKNVSLLTLCGKSPAAVHRDGTCVSLSGNEDFTGADLSWIFRENGED